MAVVPSVVLPAVIPGENDAAIGVTADATRRLSGDAVERRLGWWSVGRVTADGLFRVGALPVAFTATGAGDGRAAERCAPDGARAALGVTQVQLRLDANADGSLGFGLPRTGVWYQHRSHQKGHGDRQNEL